MDREEHNGAGNSNKKRLIIAWLDRLAETPIYSTLSIVDIHEWIAKKFKESGQQVPSYVYVQKIVASHRSSNVAQKIVKKSTIELDSDETALLDSMVPDGVTRTGFVRSLIKAEYERRLRANDSTERGSSGGN